MKKDFTRIVYIINQELKQNNINIIKLYWRIGKILNDEKYNYKEIIMLERFLQIHYGIMVGFSRRNLNNMKKFYSTYHHEDLILLEQVNWYKNLWIMRNGNKDKKYLLDICAKYDITIDDLKYISKTRDISKYKRIKNNNDDMAKELVNLKNKIHDN